MSMIPYGQHYIDEDDIQAVVEVLRHGDLTQGKGVIEFEHAMADYVGAKYAVAVSSGTCALHLAAITAGLNKTNLMATTPMTFVATANSSIYTGSRPVFVDIETDTANMSVDYLDAVIKKNNNIRVIAPVHYAGLPCDMKSIKSLAEEKNITIIEDAAHALGATYVDGKKVGSCEYSDMTVFSFHPVKAIAAGEGGMVTTNNENLYRKLLRLRSHGINKLDDEFQNIEQAYTNGLINPWYYEMQELGSNYRITDFQCKLAESQLKKLPRYVKKRNELVQRYDSAFLDFENIKPIQLNGRDKSAHHLYVLRFDFEKIGLSRAELMHELISHEIYTQVHYIPITYQPYYKNLGYVAEDYPQTNLFYSQALSLPLYYSLRNEQQDYVIETLKSILLK